MGGGQFPKFDKHGVSLVSSSKGREKVPLLVEIDLNGIGDDERSLLFGDGDHFWPRNGNLQDRGVQYQQPWVNELLID